MGFNSAFKGLNTGSKKLTKLVRKHRERYGVLNSQYTRSENLRKEKILVQTE
jgi:hypothetical protein